MGFAAAMALHSVSSSLPTISVRVHMEIENQVFIKIADFTELQGFTQH